MQQQQRVVHGLLERILDFGTHQPLHAAMRYTALNHGKRLRPILVYAVGEILGIPIVNLHAAALSVELIHCYSLIHDDLPAMDDDDLRRGLPTCHKAFDEATAILAGDALQALAFQVLSDASLNLIPATQQIAMVNVLAKAVGAMGMVLGQDQDLVAEQRALNIEELSMLHARKTGALFNACIELAILASPQPVPPHVAQCLVQYSKHLGLAFQIHDDILDVVGDQAVLGKPVGSDQKLAKSTFTSLLGVPGAQEQAAVNLQMALAAIQELDLPTYHLIELSKYIIARNS